MSCPRCGNERVYPFRDILRNGGRSEVLFTDCFQCNYRWRPFTQKASLVFEGVGLLALMRDGKPVALKSAQSFMPDPNEEPKGHMHGWWARDYWKPIDDKTAAMYRLTVQVLE